MSFSFVQFYSLSEGGHDIPQDVITRRYHRGLSNLFELYLPLCDNTMVFDNSDKTPILIFKKVKGEPTEVVQPTLFELLTNGK
jgi:predicted ABC-type ATPase